MIWYRRLLSALYLSTFLIRASFAIMVVTFPVYLDIESRFILGIVISSAPLFEFLTVLAIGALVDIYGRRNILLLGLLIGAGALFLLSLTTNLYALFIINAVHGVSAAIILVCSLALLVDYAPKDSRGREMGAFDFSNVFGWIVGFAVGGVLLDVYKGHLEYTFIFAGVLALIGFVYAFINVSEPDKYSHILKEFTFGQVRSVLTQRSILLLTLPWFIIYLLIGTIMAFFSAEGTSEGFDLKGWEIGLYLGGGGAIFLVTQVFYGKLSDKYGRMPIMFIGVAGITGLMIVFSYAYFSTPTSLDEVEYKKELLSNIIQFWPALVVCAFFAGAFAPSALASLGDEAPQKKKGMTMGVYSVVIGGGMMVGPPVVGYIGDNFGSLGVVLFISACIASMILLLTLRYLDIKQSK